MGIPPVKHPLSAHYEKYLQEAAPRTARINKQCVVQFDKMMRERPGFEELVLKFLKGKPGASNKAGWEDVHATVKEHLPTKENLKQQYTTYLGINAEATPRINDQKIDQFGRLLGQDTAFLKEVLEYLEGDLSAANKQGWGIVNERMDELAVSRSSGNAPKRSTTVWSGSGHEH